MSWIVIFLLIFGGGRGGWIFLIGGGGFKKGLEANPCSILVHLKSILNKSIGLRVIIINWFIIKIIMIEINRKTKLKKKFEIKFIQIIKQKYWKIEKDKLKLRLA